MIAPMCRSPPWLPFKFLNKSLEQNSRSELKPLQPINGHRSQNQNQMVTMKFMRFELLTLAAVLSFAPANATPLLPGGSASLFLEPEPVGASLVASTNVSFTGVNFFGDTKFTGSLLSQVWSGDSSNPFGGLTFTYILSNDNSSVDAIGRLTLSSFGGYSTDVSFFTNTFSGVIPFNAVRSGGSGDQIDFNLLSGPPNFQHNLLPGESTYLLVLQTSSPVYNIGNASIIDSAVANAVALVPTTVVPEPGTLGLATLGLAGLFARRKLGR